MQICAEILRDEIRAVPCPILQRRPFFQRGTRKFGARKLCAVFCGFSVRGGLQNELGRGAPMPSVVIGLEGLRDQKIIGDRRIGGLGGIRK